MKITSIQQQQRQHDRYSLYVDDKYAFSLSESALLSAGISSGQELSRAELKQFKQLSADDKAFGRALKYVLMRPRSEWEMTEYLRRKEVAEPTVDTIMGRLRQSTLLDDRAFARSWVENRRVLKPTSRQRLSQELRQKHVASDIIDDVLREDTQEIDEQQIIRDVIERKRKRYPDQQKLIAYLARQGYRYDDIKSALAAGLDY